MLLMKLAEFGWIGAAEMSVFHELSAGNTVHAPVDGVGVGLGVGAGGFEVVAVARRIVVATGGCAVVVVATTNVVVDVDVLVVVDFVVATLLE